MSCHLHRKQAEADPDPAVWEWREGDIQIAKLYFSIKLVLQG